MKDNDNKSHTCQWEKGDSIALKNEIVKRDPKWNKDVGTYTEPGPTPYTIKSIEPTYIEVWETPKNGFNDKVKIIPQDEWSKWQKFP